MPNGPKKKINTDPLQFDAYTPLNTSQDKILKECANTEFKEAKIRNPYPIMESAWTNIFIYFHFHKSRDYNANNYIQLKDAVEWMIKKWWFTEYAKDDKRGQ